MRQVTEKNSEEHIYLNSVLNKLGLDIKNWSPEGLVCKYHEICPLTYDTAIDFLTVINTWMPLLSQRFPSSAAVSRLSENGSSSHFMHVCTPWRKIIREYVSGGLSRTRLRWITTWSQDLKASSSFLHSFRHKIGPPFVPLNVLQRRQLWNFPHGSLLNQLESVFDWRSLFTQFNRLIEASSVTFTCFG